MRPNEELAEEVPAALVYRQRVHAVMMCTPSDLEDLGMGFTVTEGIAAPADIFAVDVARHHRGIEITVGVPEEAAQQLESRRRAMTGRTGCGLCGVEAIDDAVRPVPRLAPGQLIAAEALRRAGDELQGQQPMNARTRAMHAAGWADQTGRLQFVREDVGRHNALDKVIGAVYRAGLTPSAGFVVITSRASFEMVQKAAACGITTLAAVSRPTELAVQLATDAGMTLVGVLRGDDFTVYTRPGVSIP